MRVHLIEKLLTLIAPRITVPSVLIWIPPPSILEHSMKKMLILSVLSVFALGLMAQTAFAFGDCSGKSKKTTTTVEISTIKVDKS